jgi:hypothetical protein
VTVIITLVIIRIVPATIHPTVVGEGSEAAEGAFSMGPTMVTALLFNLAVWTTLVPITMMWYRIRLQNFAERVDAMKARLINQ